MTTEEKLLKYESYLFRSIELAEDAIQNDDREVVRQLMYTERDVTYKHLVYLRELFKRELDLHGA